MSYNYAQQRAERPRAAQVHKTITDERVVSVSPTREGQDIVRSLGLAVEQLKDQILPSKQRREFLQGRQRFIYLNLD